MLAAALLWKFRPRDTPVECDSSAEHLCAGVEKSRREAFMPDRHDRKLALIKVADDVVLGEQFWILRLEPIHGTMARSEAPIDAATAEAQLQQLGCDAWQIAQLLHDARDAFNGLPSTSTDAQPQQS
jgi:hypothetical protein